MFQLKCDKILTSPATIIWIVIRTKLAHEDLFNLRSEMFDCQQVVSEIRLLSPITNVRVLDLHSLLEKANFQRKTVYLRNFRRLGYRLLFVHLRYPGDIDQVDTEIGSSSSLCLTVTMTNTWTDQSILIDCHNNFLPLTTGGVRLDGYKV